VSESNTRLSWWQVRDTFVDWYIYLYAVIVMCNLAVIKCLVMNLPSIMGSIGFSNAESHLMTIPPYVLSCLGCLIGGYSSTRHLEHSFHYTFLLSIGILGFVLMLIVTNQIKAATYISICIAHCGTFAALPILLAWLTNNIGGHTKRTVAVSFVTGVGQIGGILVPQVRLLI
jgi:predicted MFS family arabinose efflux permease